MSVGVEVRPSGIPGAGRGVFATRDFAIGEFVCVYDGYVITPGRQNLDEDVYALPLEGKGMLIGFKDPKSEIGVAQLINDAAEISAVDFPQRGDFKMCCLYFADAALRYAVKTRLLSNVYPANGTERFIAIKPINKGEELFFSYGSSYWFFQIASDALIAKDRKILEARQAIQGAFEQQGQNHRGRFEVDGIYHPDELTRESPRIFKSIVGTFRDMKIPDEYISMIRKNIKETYGF